jgi:4'-phosphopantetheinyl transferase
MSAEAWPAAAPGPAEVHVWLAPLAVAASDLSALAASLSADERERAGRYRFERDRRFFAAGRGILRRLLGAYLGLPPAAIAFTTGPHGKPRLISGGPGDSLRFNLSHSGGLALIALARGREVGVDLERVRPIGDLPTLAGSCCSRTEARRLLALAEADRLPAFFRTWTRKEAYLKARGDGLSLPPEHVEVADCLGEAARLLHVVGAPGEEERWSLWGLTPAPDAVGAVAVEGRGCRLFCFRDIPSAGASLPAESP